MWVFTSGGFVSAVSHRDDDNLLMVRARDELSLKVMKQGIEQMSKPEGTELVEIKIYSEGGSDYPWRAVVSKDIFGEWLKFEVTKYLNYPNFKSELTAQRGEVWHRAAMNVWTDMLAVEDKPQGWRPYQHLGDAELMELITKSVEDADLPLTEDELAVLTDLGEGYNDSQAAYNAGAAVLEDDELHNDIVAMNQKDRLMEVPSIEGRKGEALDWETDDGGNVIGKGSEDVY